MEQPKGSRLRVFSLYEAIASLRDTYLRSRVGGAKRPSSQASIGLVAIAGGMFARDANMSLSQGWGVG